MIKKAKAAGVKIGLCGQAPSDYPAFAQFLVKEGIDSISFNADALLKGIENIVIAENINRKAISLKAEPFAKVNKEPHHNGIEKLK
jgi:phosphoenolpyruvate-protein kinase (PTS system EI component)